MLVRLGGMVFFIIAPGYEILSLHHWWRMVRCRIVKTIIPMDVSENQNYKSFAFSCGGGHLVYKLCNSKLQREDEGLSFFRKYLPPYRNPVRQMHRKTFRSNVFTVFFVSRLLSVTTSAIHLFCNEVYIATAIQ